MTYKLNGLLYVNFRWFKRFAFYIFVLPGI